MPLIEAAGLSFHYEDHGAGAPVVLLHALSFDGSMWATQMDQLSREFRVVAYDARDHGRTSSSPCDYDVDLLAADTLAVLDALGLKRVHLVGLSMGGMVAMRVALRAPERLRTLSLLSTSAEADKGRLRRSIEAWLAVAGDRPPIDIELDGMIGHLFSPAFALGSPDVVAAHRARMAATPRARMRRPTLAILRRDDVLTRLGRLRVPTLVLVGGRDISTPRDHAERLAATIPGAELVVLPECGHVTALEAPDVVSVSLRRTFARAAETRGDALEGPRSPL